MLTITPKAVIMLIGAPGSGKSTYAEEHLQGYVRVSADDIRARLGDVSDQTRNKEVWDLVRAELAACIKTRVICYLDATGANPYERREMVRFLHNAGAWNVNAIWIDTPKDVCLANNAARDRKVPEHVIERMHDALTHTPPSKADGFDFVERVELSFAE